MPKKQVCLRKRALDDLLTNTGDVIDDFWWDWQTGKISTEQYGREIDLLVEQRMVEISQRQPEMDDDMGDYQRKLERDSA